MKRFYKICLGMMLVFGGLAIVNGADVLVGKIMKQVYASDGQKIVTIYDKNHKQTVLTTHKTVGEVLTQADIKLGKYDIVEPELSAEISDGFNVNIFRARPLTVIDGELELNILTPYQLASDIAKHAGLEVFPEDEVEFTTNPLMSGVGVGSQMVIRRAAAFNLNLFGKQNIVRTRKATVGEFLTEKNIVLSNNERMNLTKNSKIRAEMELIIWQEGEQEIVSEEEIDFSVRKVLNHNKPTGYREVEQEGVKGKRVVTYKINIRNGQEVARTAIKTVVISEPKEQVEVIGAKVDLPVGSHEDWMAVAGINSSDFGYVNYIISRESGWSPTKWNYAGSGAYGLCQSLPASKMASAGGDYMTNPITQLRWCNSYAIGRYGSWEKAYNFWIAKHWW